MSKLEAYQAARRGEARQAKADIIITGRQRQWLIEWKSDKLSEWRPDVPDVQDREQESVRERGGKAQ